MEQFEVIIDSRPEEEDEWLSSFIILPLSHKCRYLNISSNVVLPIDFYIRVYYAYDMYFPNTFSFLGEGHVRYKTPINAYISSKSNVKLSFFLYSIRNTILQCVLPNIYLTNIEKKSSK